MKKQKIRQGILKAILIISLLLFPVTINYFPPYLIYGHWCDDQKFCQMDIFTFTSSARKMYQLQRL